MIPHVAPRGRSFKGAGLYYLHDKGAMTSERIAWTHTHNLPTDDPEKALRWMAHTSMNADRLKSEAGVAKTGRKSKAGAVYSFSLAWHPEQQPEKEQMLNAAFETLEKLGLIEHQAVMVAHQETEHPHVHVICNLVNPNNGRTVSPSYDYLKFSTWAEEQEVRQDKIYCEERVINNERRRGLAKEDRQAGLAKRREPKPDHAARIQNLYNRADSGKAFQTALAEAGYTLAKGDRRGFVLVDEDGKIHSLSRQLQGQRAEDIKTRLADIDERSLPEAKTVSDERRYFDRERYETETQKAIVDAAIEQADSEKRNQTQEEVKRQAPGTAKEKETRLGESEQFLADLDKRRAWEQDVQRRRDQLEKQLSEFYRRENLDGRLKELQQELEQNKGFWGLISGKTQELQEEIEALGKNLASIDLRIEEQRRSLEDEIERSRKETFSAAERAKQLEIEQKRQHQTKALKAQMNSKFGRSDHDCNQGHDLDLGR